MSDPSGPLRLALEPWLRADAGVIAAFAGKPVKVFNKLPPIDAKAPYLFIAGFFVLPELADCMDNAEVDVQVDVWSLTNPPGFAEAERLAPAVVSAMQDTEDTGQSPAFSVTGWRVVSALPVSTTYLTDPSDGKTVHAVTLTRLSLDRVD